MKKTIYILSFLAFGIFSCAPNITTITPSEQQPTLPETVYNYSDLKLPVLQNFQTNFNQQDDENPSVTDHGATLGRVLFYDNKLSINDKVSCGSCHLQSKAFADEEAFSVGFEGKLTERNSIAILNPGFCDNLFWDSRASSALDLTLKPVQNHIEMGIEDLDFLASKLAKVDYYQKLFKNAYNSSEVTPEKISDAVAQFLCSMTTFDSKFDRAKAEFNNFSSLSTLEKTGKKLFEGFKFKCSSCHSGDTFSAESQNSGYSSPDVKGATNIGLDRRSEDQGKENGAFRIPSLRNIELTSPYMHDGRFNTLEEVIDHYSKGIVFSENLDPKFKSSNNSALQMNINDFEKTALIAFLKTLTDETFISDPKFSDPFEK